MKYSKSALTYEQQIQLVISRGLEVADHERALQVLERISYYRLAGYWLPFRLAGSDNFVPGSTFEEVVRLYEFDRRLRLLVLDAVERLEVALRTSITYQFGRAYGAFGHLDVANFAKERWLGEHVQWVETVRQEASRARELFVGSYKGKYDGFPDLPIWMASEVMSLGTLSKMLASMKNPDQKAVAISFRIHQSVLPSWIHTVSVVRNRSAHHSRVWNWQLRVAPKKIDKVPNWNRQALRENDRMFFFLLILKKLLTAVGDHHVGAWRDQVTHLLRPVLATEKYRTEMGAPASWEDDVLWR